MRDVIYGRPLIWTIFVQINWKWRLSVSSSSWPCSPSLEWSSSSGVGSATDPDRQSLTLPTVQFDSRSEADLPRQCGAFLKYKKAVCTIHHFTSITYNEILISKGNFCQIQSVIQIKQNLVWFQPGISTVNWTANPRVPISRTPSNLVNPYSYENTLPATWPSPTDTGSILLIATSILS